MRVAIEQKITESQETALDLHQPENDCCQSKDSNSIVAAYTGSLTFHDIFPDEQPDPNDAYRRAKWTFEEYGVYSTLWSLSSEAHPYRSLSLCVYQVIEAFFKYIQTLVD